MDRSSTQFDAEAHAGVMRPLRLSQPLTLVPSATIELARITNVRGDWSGGALGPGEHELDSSTRRFPSLTSCAV